MPCTISGAGVSLAETQSARLVERKHTQHLQLELRHMLLYSTCSELCLHLGACVQEGGLSRAHWCQFRALHWETAQVIPSHCSLAGSGPCSGARLALTNPQQNVGRQRHPRYGQTSGTPVVFRCGTFKDQRPQGEAPGGHVKGGLRTAGGLCPNCPNAPCRRAPVAGLERKTKAFRKGPGETVLISCAGLCWCRVRYLKAPSGRVQVTYQWRKFKNEARSDGLELEHWAKCYRDHQGKIRAENEGEYKYAKYDRKVRGQKSVSLQPLTAPLQCLGRALS